MKVKVKFFAELRELFGKEAEMDCECERPEELLSALYSRFPGLKEKAEEYGELGLVVLVNGRDIRHLDKIEGEEITVSVFPPAAGG